LPLSTIWLIRELMKIAVIGAGAIGGWVAAKLALAHEQVMALTSRGYLEQIDIIENASRQTARLSRFSGAADVLVIAVKATSLRNIVTGAKPLISPATTIVPMMNGVPWWFIEGVRLKSVDPSGEIASTFPSSQVTGCVVHASCSRSGGAVLVKHADKLIIGKPNGELGEDLAHLHALFDRAGLRAETSDNIRSAIWYKLWGNATINPMSALTRATCDRILSDPECRSWMLEGMSELASAGAAIGCPISESGADRMAVTERLGAFKTSMLQDVEAGRPLELEALLGAPREIARAHQLETPALDRLYALTKLLADGLGLH